MSRFAFIALAAALLVITYFLFPPITTVGDLGICLPSPNSWELPHIVGWGISSVLIFLSAGIMASSNKQYNFIPNAGYIMPLTLLLLLGCNTVSTATLTASTLLLFCNVVCLFIVLSTYEEKNASREFFIVASIASIGTMFQYAFLMMVPVYIVAGILIKSFHFRELIAFIFGLIAPYWIAVGMGLVPLLNFRLPETLTVFSKEAVESDIFLTMLATGGMAIIGFILSLYNAVRLYSRNSRLRCMHMTFNTMGYVAVIAAVCDFTNFVAYFATIALWMAIELATLLHLYKVHHPKASLILLLTFFLPLYILSLINT